MGMTNFPTVSRGVADSVAAAQEDQGFQQTAVTAEGSVDLSAWAGLYIRVQVIGDDYDVCFVEAAATTISTGNIAVGAAGAVAERIAKADTTGDKTQMVVPGKKTILKYKPVNGTSSTIRITRA